MSGVNWLYGEGGLLPWADGKTGSALVGGETFVLERTCAAVRANESDVHACSACGADVWASADSVTPYCPMCGAKVEGGTR